MEPSAQAPEIPSRNMIYAPESPGNTTSTGPDLPLVDQDRGCVRCGYNLLGLRVNGICPECGTPVADSLKGFLLQFSDATYLKTVQSGVGLVLNAILLMIVLSVIGLVAGVAAASGGVGSQATIQVGLAFGSLVLTGMLLLGYWRYSQPDPAYVGMERTDSARSVIRGSVIAMAIISLLSLVIQVMLLLSFAAADVTIIGIFVAISLALNLLSLVAWLVNFIATTRYTRWLAGRIPDAYIVRRTRRYIWLLPVVAIVGAPVLFIGPLFALVRYWNLLDRVRKQLKAIRTTGQPAELKGRLG